MLALPFTILTNALSGGHMGTYLGLFNGTICVPQIVAAALGGQVLHLFTRPGAVPPEVNMLVLAGCLLIIGAMCVSIIKEKMKNEELPYLLPKSIGWQRNNSSFFIQLIPITSCSNFSLSPMALLRILLR